MGSIVEVIKNFEESLNTEVEKAIHKMKEEAFNPVLNEKIG